MMYCILIYFTVGWKLKSITKNKKLRSGIVLKTKLI